MSKKSLFYCVLVIVLFLSGCKVTTSQQITNTYDLVNSDYSMNFELVEDSIEIAYESLDTSQVVSKFNLEEIKENNFLWEAVNLLSSTGTEFTVFFALSNMNTFNTKLQWRISENEHFFIPTRHFDFRGNRLSFVIFDELIEDYSDLAIVFLEGEKIIQAEYLDKENRNSVIGVE